ncbi:ribonuclease H-like domain-containing protein [Tanacetum coccineum]|uniref:Ribonuclease H-like domain-containing protein n=1 Tax=Tanacetum coccineum TaxID=301880 RepID=A0ABQ4YCE7_9ASTR
MFDEYNALLTNGMWILVPRPANMNVVRFMCLFRQKFHTNGSLSRYKARLVVNGCSQQQASSASLLQCITSLLHSEFAMTDIGCLGSVPHPEATDRRVLYVLQVSSTAQLTAYTDANWAGVPVTQYRGVVNVVAETGWTRNLLCELHAPLFTTTLVYCDNVSVVYMHVYPIQHQRTKHIEIDIHFVLDFVASGQVCVLHVPSQF